MDKRALRKTMRALRRGMPPSVRGKVSRDICERLLRHCDLQEAVAAQKMFAVYLASPEEIDLSVFVERLWAANCPVAVPAWRNGTYVLAHYARDTLLAAGPMGIREPADVAEIVPTCAPAVWIVPGLAFSAQGARLGYGGGWYDRFLSAAAPGAISIGVAYDFQVLPELPVEPHDIALTDVVSQPVRRIASPL